jgi:hypothetical protein
MLKNKKLKVYGRLTTFMLIFGALNLQKLKRFSELKNQN